MITSRAVSAQRRCSTVTGWAATASGFGSAGSGSLSDVVVTGAGGLGDGSTGGGSGA
ncbi:hypothetical protein [Nocardia sp. AG03]|uniref:hypothetical protein n=1 Tax=Nocardia sp. AG03 TaxID=3025312 RepID=UPI002418263A|nr:hypothetical protein [Nocardia sp. AG03]